MYNCTLFPKKVAEIVEYLLVCLAGMLLVHPGIGNLHIEVYQINVGQYSSAEHVKVEISAGFQNNVDLTSLETFQQRLDVPGIQGTFTA